MAQNKTQTKDAPEGAPEVLEGQEVFDLPGMAAPEASQLATVPPVTIAQWRKPLSEDEMVTWISAQILMVGDDETDRGMSMMADVLNAATLEDALSGRVETTKSRDILDVILECNWIKFVKSDLADGCPFFAILDVRNTSTGERETISLGGWYAIAQCGRMLYQAVPIPADSAYAVAPEYPKAWEHKPFPHFFRIKQKETPKGHMNYLAPVMG